MGEPNLEKFLPALIGLIGRAAGAAGKAGIGGGDEEEEEKSMDKQQIEKSLLKLMKGGSFYGGAREPKGGVAQGKLPAGDSPWGPEENKARQDAAKDRYMESAPFLEIMERAGIKPHKKPKEEPFVKPKEAMEKAGRDMEIAGPDKGRDEIKFRSPVSTHPENVRMPTPEDPRTSSDVRTPSEESNGFGMGDLEARIAGKTRNKPTHGVRMRKPPVDDYRRNREGPPEGRKVTEQGATPSFSASLKALNKMVDEGFLSKKADPAMAAQNRAATRQRGAATQERIAGKHAQDAGAVGGPADNTAQQIGSEVAGNVGWMVDTLLREKKDAAKAAKDANGVESLDISKPWETSSSQANTLNLEKPWQSNNTANPKPAGAFGTAPDVANHPMFPSQGKKAAMDKMLIKALL